MTRHRHRHQSCCGSSPVDLPFFWHYKTSGFKKRDLQNPHHSNIIRRLLSGRSPQQDFKIEKCQLFMNSFCGCSAAPFGPEKGLWLQNREGTLPECEPQPHYFAKASGTAATATLSRSQAGLWSFLTLGPFEPLRLDTDTDTPTPTPTLTSACHVCLCVCVNLSRLGLSLRLLLR